MDRIRHVAAHVVSSNVDSDVVICAAVRTPICRARKGGLKSVTPEDMLVPLFVDIVKRSGIAPEHLGEVCIGNVLGGSVVGISARMAQLGAGVPINVPTSVVNRQCSSGLNAIHQVVMSIRLRQIECGIGGGVESMTLNDIRSMVDPTKYSDKLKQDTLAGGCLMPMVLTSENIAEKYGISRSDQDALALVSHQKAAQARSLGYFREEIVPVTVDGENGPVIVSEDDGIRPDVSAEQLRSLKTIFKKDGSTTAGNASQISDGASLVLVASRSFAQRNNLPILAKWLSFAVAGCQPTLMGAGPVFAVPKALESAGLRVEDIDWWELNEAFASQVVYCVRELKIPLEKVNPCGGAIALGHPLGSTGARCVATLINQLHRSKKRYGVVTMCVGTGMGAACVLEREGV